MDDNHTTQITDKHVHWYCFLLGARIGLILCFMGLFAVQAGEPGQTDGQTDRRTLPNVLSSLLCE